MAAAKKGADDRVTASSGNAFRDLRVSRAEELQTKAKIAFALNKILDKEEMTQQQIADRLHTDQPKVSAVRNYKLENLSVERLMEFLIALDYDIDINIKPKKQAEHSKSGRINVNVKAA
jgi:predicted XRE-type DNA-binding protein